MFSRAKILFLVSLLFDPYSLIKLLILFILVCLLFKAYLHSIIIRLHNHIIYIYIYINQSVLSRHLIRYRHLPNYVLQVLVNKSVNMVKQLYYSKIHSKNVKIYLSKL